ncbi:MAG: glycosyltransferase family 4 protein, partial [bacterium]
VELVCPPPPPEANRSLWEEARARGVEPVAALERGRSALRPGDGAVVTRLRRWLHDDADGAPFDVVHCWHGRDHVLAARALRRLRGRPPRRGLQRAGSPAIVRSLASAEPVAAWPWNRWLLGPACDGLICVSRSAREAQRPLRGGRPIAAVPGAVEAERLRSGRDPQGDRSERTATRTRLGIAAGAPVIGVVARIQRHRRFDLLLEAMQRLIRARPDARLVLIGRGTHAETVAAEPARRMGLSAHVVFAGYRVADYAALLRCLDVFCFLVPGSDGSCRALLEAATVGLPLVGTRRGAIAEIIRDGETGELVDEDPEHLARAWLRLIEDPARRRALGEAAARDARRRFTPEGLAASVEALYAEAMRTQRR